MSLVLSGAKTVTIAGSEMVCLEIYTEEAYTLPFYFVDNSNVAVDCTDPSLWTLNMSAKWYTANITYSDGDLINPSSGNINVANLELVSPQPSQNPNLVAVYTNAASGEGYIYIPDNITGTTPETTPGIAANPTQLVITTLEITRTDLLSGLPDISREPIGLIVRYQ
jgi:hypothetical protein